MSTPPRPDEAAPGAPAPTAAALLGRRLQRLIDTGYPTGERRYTDVEIAEHVRVSSQYISNLRKGKSVPTLEKAVRLADFFDIPSSDYFLRPAGDPAVHEVERTLRALETGDHHLPTAPGRRTAPPAPDRDNPATRMDELMVKHRVKELALRANELSDEGLTAVLGIVDQILGNDRPPPPARDT
ncbi:helix-turn-helix domain-containing protein [Streptomyces albireticuli]|nr:helix-turn-helix transcriptional regulator [Streptomyces albireticuli]MCD9145988.1 helix-turn-helix domain-containing protein [Streptomyces albireticuli]MCD9165750.1 helix-turn-helix domain-containing protein [Streptomyces albireticuli]MCD9195968.1 helix-turn-helix domain-containing protein [Streptomyces albireticuli]